MLLLTYLTSVRLFVVSTLRRPQHNPREVLARTWRHGHKETVFSQSTYDFCCQLSVPSQHHIFIHSSFNQETYNRHTRSHSSIMVQNHPTEIERTKYNKKNSLTESTVSWPSVRKGVRDNMNLLHLLFLLLIIIIIIIQLQLGWNPVAEVYNTYTATV
jgi:hypothetical protein